MFTFAQIVWLVQCLVNEDILGPCCFYTSQDWRLWDEYDSESDQFTICLTLDCKKYILTESDMTHAELFARYITDALGCYVAHLQRFVELQSKDYGILRRQASLMKAILVERGEMSFGELDEMEVLDAWMELKSRPSDDLLHGRLHDRLH
jgi:hypothetical protein